LIKNRDNSGQARYIDARRYYLRESINEGLVTIEFIKPEERFAEKFTKNLGYQLFTKHMK
jgi:hypothetical protein